VWQFRIANQVRSNWSSSRSKPHTRVAERGSGGRRREIRGIGVTRMRILMAGFIVIGILIPISALGGRPIPANAAPTPTFAVNSQNPTGAAANPSNYPYTLNSISCPSSSWCAGVGDWWEVHTVGGYTSPMAQIWSGGTWSTSITGDYLRDTDLDGVSCVSASFCAAVGDTNTAWTPYQAAYAEIWNGSA